MAHFKAQQTVATGLHDVTAVGGHCGRTASDLDAGQAVAVGVIREAGLFARQADAACSRSDGGTG